MISPDRQEDSPAVVTPKVDQLNEESEVIDSSTHNHFLVFIGNEIIRIDDTPNGRAGLGRVFKLLMDP